MTKAPIIIYSAFCKRLTIQGAVRLQWRDISPGLGSGNGVRKTSQGW